MFVVAVIGPYRSASKRLPVPVLSKATTCLALRLNILSISIGFKHMRGICDELIPFCIKENAVLVQGEGRRFINL